MAGEPYNALLARIGFQAEADVVVFGGLGLIFDDYHFFRTAFEEHGVFHRDLELSPDGRFAGVENVDALFKTLDGYDITPCVTGDKDFRRAGPIVVHSPHVYAGNAPHTAMRDGNWKLIFFYRTQHWELYDLSKDPYEWQNLSSDNPEKVEELRRKLEEWW